MDSVLGLDRLTGGMGVTVGGKAANLGSLFGAGFPVPPGFCVTTSAYREVVGGLLDPLWAELQGHGGVEDSAHPAGSQGLEDVSSAAARARELVLTAPVPAEIADAVLASYRALGAPPVAVRSSATAEDLEYASFAGQQDTYLNVTGEEAVLEAVRRCWASLWTDRAVTYRNLHQISHDSVALAVVVQEMVQAAAAGVMFTANPVTGARHQTVIDASPGLGEAVVSGAVNPDHFVVDRTKSTIVTRRLGDKRVLIRSLADGGTERLDLDDSSSEAALTDQQVIDLAALGDRVQQHYGAPQDIEWALDDQGELWLTQSRPITTLFPLLSGVEADAAARPRVYLCMTLAQGLTRPITPVGLSAFRLIASSVAAAAGSPPPNPFRGPRAFAEAGQRVFVDVTGVIGNPVGRKVALAALGVMEARAAVVVRQLIADPAFARTSGSPLAALVPVARVVWKARVPQRAVVAAVSPTAALRAIAALEEGLLSDLELPEGVAPEERLDQVEHLLGKAFWFMPRVIAYSIAGFALLALARRLLRGQLQPGELQTVLRGLPHNVTTEMDLNLWQLSCEIGADPAARAAFTASTASEVAAQYRLGHLPPVAQDGLAAFLQRYGHRAVAEIDLGMPRWSDDPSHLVGMIANYLRQSDPTLAADTQFRAANAAAQAMVAALQERVRQQGPLRAGLVGFGLRRARRLAGLREAPKNLLVLTLAGIRAHLAAVGEALAAEGRISAGDDVFFLELTEVRAGLAGADLRDLVSRRREDYAAELHRRHIPRVLLSDGTEPEALGLSGARPDGALVGSAASTGKVTGRARVILDPVGAHLEPGEILVAPSTDPGWTPLFLTAGGLVMEMGGSNSHGAVVAREYGIPAVVGVPDATSRLSTGQTVTVDGAAGLVLASPDH